MLQFSSITGSFKKDVLEESIQKLVLVCFSAAWCGPCKMLEPVLEKLAQELKEQLKVVKIDVEADPSLAATYHIRSVPTMVVFKKGQEVSVLVGNRPYSELKQAVQSYLD